MENKNSNSKIISKQSGAGFKLHKGQKLQVIDLEGEQVADLFCISLTQPLETLSSGRSIDYNDTVSLTQGHLLYSNRSQPMLKIIKDDCGRHDFLLTPCSLEMFRIVSQTQDYHPSCHENLATALKNSGFPKDYISTSFNIFMNVEIQSDGKIQIKPPLSKPGTSIYFEAWMDLWIGLTACSDESTNNGRCKPIGYRIF